METCSDHSVLCLDSNKSVALCGIGPSNCTHEELASVSTVRILSKRGMAGQLVLAPSEHVPAGVLGSDATKKGHCDLLLFTGDLAATPGRQYAVAKSLARCGPKVFGLLGNHDGGSGLLASCDAHGYRRWEWWLSFGHAGRVRQLRSLLGDHEIGLARQELPHLAGQEEMTFIILLSPWTSWCGSASGFRQSVGA